MAYGEVTPWYNLSKTQMAQSQSTTKVREELNPLNSKTKRTPTTANCLDHLTTSAISTRKQDVTGHDMSRSYIIVIFGCFCRTWQAPQEKFTRCRILPCIHEILVALRSAVATCIEMIATLRRCSHPLDDASCMCIEALCTRLSLIRV